MAGIFSKPGSFLDKNNDNGTFVDSETGEVIGTDKKALKDWQKANKGKKAVTRTQYNTSQNLKKTSAATQAPLNSSRNVSVASDDKAVQAINEKAKAVDEAKMKPVTPESKVEVVQAEKNLQDVNNAVQEDLVNNPNTDEHFVDPTAQPTQPSSPETTKEIITNEIGVDENTSPEEAKQRLLDKLLSEGFVQTNPDGSISVSPYKQSTKSKLATLGTALSIVASVASGGVIPAVDVSKLTGVAEDEKSARQVYDNFMKQVTDTYGDIFRTETTADEDAELATKAGEYGYRSSGQFARDQQQLVNTLRTMKESNATAKDYAEFMANLSSKQLVLAINAARDAGISLDDIARYQKANGGITGFDNALNKANQIVNMGASAVGTVVKASTGL